jgi:hypothetical protein
MQGTEAARMTPNDSELRERHPERDSLDDLLSSVAANRLASP